MKTIDLRSARERRGLTQEQLAEKSGVGQNTISRIETGVIVNPTADTLLSLADALDLDPRALKFGAERKAS